MTKNTILSHLSVNEQSDYELINESGLINHNFLIINGLDLDLDPIMYFIKNYVKEDLIIPFVFVTGSYLKQYLNGKDINPLVHYLSIEKEGSNLNLNTKNQLFIDSLFLLEIKFDWSNYSIINNIENDNKSAIIHYCMNWEKSLPDIPLIFSTKFYCLQNSDVKEAKCNPLIHYLQFGYKEGRKGYSIEQYSLLSELIATLENSLLFMKDFVEITLNKKFNNKREAIVFYLYHDKDILTHPLININFYRREYRDKLGELPEDKVLISYLQKGYKNLVSITEFFDIERYFLSNGDLTKDIEPITHYLNWGEKEFRTPSKYFDPQIFINECNNNKIDIPERLLETYVTENKYWDLKTSEWFDGGVYRKKYRDLTKINKNPLSHYLLYGMKEKRENISAPSLPLINNSKSELDGVITYPSDRFVNLRSKSILLVAHVAGDNIFGSERSFIDMVIAAYESGHNVYVTLPQNSVKYLAMLQPYCVSIIVFKYSWWRNNTLLDDSVVNTFRRIIKSLNIDIVHVNTLVLREAHIAATQAKVPSLCHIREMIKDDPDLIKAMGISINTILGFLNQWVDGFIFNSHTTKLKYNELENKFNHVSYNVIQKDFIQTEIVMPEGAILKVGLISSNIPKKGIYEFLKIARLINDAGYEQNIEFNLIGPKNKYTEEIDKLVKSENVTNFVNCGYFINSIEAIDSCNIILSISNFAESFGRTVAEAFARKKLVVCYDYGAVSELVGNNERGYLVERNDLKAIADILIDQIKSGLNHNMLEQAYSFAHQNLTSDSLNSRTNIIYNDFYNANKTKKLLFEPLSDLTKKYISDNNWIYVSENKSNIKSKIDIKIAYFLWHFPVPSETFVLNELRYLVENNYSVEVFCKQSPFKDFIPDFDIKWTRVNDIDDFSNKLKIGKFDIVHSHFTYPTVTDMVWPACEKSEIYFSFIAHSQDIFKYENFEKNRIVDISKSKYLKKLFVPGEFHRNYLLDIGIAPEVLFVNPQGVNPERYPLNMIQPDNQKMKICVINRFVEKKGIIYLLDAARQLDYIEVNIYGYGELESLYIDYIQEHSITNVSIHGGLSGLEEIGNILKEHDLFLAPAVRAENGDMDGIPTVLMEAMAMGIPVAASDVSSISDLIIDGSTGFLFESRSVAALCSAIERFKNTSKDRNTQLRAAARAKIVNDYNTPRLVNNLLNIWKDQRLDIILVTYNNLPELKKVVERLYLFEQNFDLIIVDNGSESELIQYLNSLCVEHNNITFIKSEFNVFVGGGTNIALNYCKNKYSVYLCGKEGFAAKSNWILPIISEMEESNAIMGGNLVVADAYLTFSDFPNGVVNFNNFRNKNFANGNQNKAYHVQGGIIAMNSHKVRELGGFNLDVPHNYTDVEMGFYLESLGSKIIQLSSILSLFEGSQPDFKHFMNDNISLFHPITIENEHLVETLATNKITFCNICQSKSDTNLFQMNGFCNQCKSSPLARLLALIITREGYYMKRKHGLVINPPAGFDSFWSKSFRGSGILESAFKEKVIDGWLGVRSSYELVIWNVVDSNFISEKVIAFIMSHIGESGELIITGYNLINDINISGHFKVKEVSAIYSQTNDYASCKSYILSK
jgi:glycosyltransferase involved in cell wall biosynthesis